MSWVILALAAAYGLTKRRTRCRECDKLYAPERHRHWS